MTVQDMIDILEKMPRGAEILMAHQPNYPLASTIWGVAYRIFPDDEVNVPGREGLTHFPAAVFICEGTQLGYASHTLWDENAVSTWRK